MATAKKVVTKSPGNQDAVGLPISDPREVKALFEKYEELVEAKGEASDLQALAETMCDMLTVPRPSKRNLLPGGTRGYRVRRSAR